MSQYFSRKLTYILGGAVLLILLLIVSLSIASKPTQYQIESDFADDLEVNSQQNLSDSELNSAAEVSQDAPAGVLELQEEPQQHSGRRTERVLSSDDPGFSIDDLAHLDLGFNQSEKTQTSPEPVIEALAAIEVVESEPQESIVVDTSVVEEYPSIKNVSFRDCGQLIVPTGFGLAMFSLTLGSDTVIECLGEAVASASCSAYEAEVMMDNSVTSLYVVSRPDDEVCSVGIPANANLLSLCSVESLMDVGFSEDKTFRQWQRDFKNNPGKSFASLYFENSTAFQSSNNLSVYDCKLYEM
jgi:hypothetical protein